MKCNRCGLEIQRIHARSQVNGNWYHLPRRCVELLRQQIHDLQASTIQVADFGGKAAVELTAEITRLREENVELQNERDKYIGATQCATRSAERRWQKLQAIMQIIGTQGDPEVEVSAVMTDLERANNENAALREDKARLDWLEHEGFATRSDPDKIGVHCWRLDKSTWRWTAHWISSEFTTARAAIDAARKGGPR